MRDPFTLNPDGSFDYVPQAGFLGNDSFTYQANDGISQSDDPATVTISVTDNAPVAFDDTYFVPASTSLVQIDATDGILENDLDPDDDPLTAVLVTGDSNLTSLNPDGSFTLIGPNNGVGAVESFTYQANDGAMLSNVVTVNVVFVDIKITNPVDSNGGPINQPADNDGNGNEFTFDGSNPGVLTIPVRVQVTPDTQQVRDLIGSEMGSVLTGVGDSQEIHTGFQYDSSSGLWTDTVKYVGLPANNDDFGDKSVSVMAGPFTGDNSVAYQVFFDKNAANHPGGDDTPPNSNSARSPNWFHYWLQGVGSPSDVYYNSNLPAGLGGMVPAMYYWADPLGYSKTEIWIGDPASGAWTRQFQTANTPEDTTGIDTFANIIEHEQRHVFQIQTADALLPNANAAGWSWNTTPNNHGQFDMNNNDLPDNMEANLVGPVNGMVEEDARTAEDVPENSYWQEDWGDDGKQHDQDMVYNN